MKSYVGDKQRWETVKKNLFQFQRKNYIKLNPTKFQKLECYRKL